MKATLCNLFVCLFVLLFRLECIKAVRVGRVGERGGGSSFLFVPVVPVCSDSSKCNRQRRRGLLSSSLSVAAGDVSFYSKHVKQKQQQQEQSQHLPSSCLHSLAASAGSATPSSPKDVLSNNSSTLPPTTTSSLLSTIPSSSSFGMADIPGLDPGDAPPGEFHFHPEGLTNAGSGTSTVASGTMRVDEMMEAIKRNKGGGLEGVDRPEDGGGMEQLSGVGSKGGLSGGSSKGGVEGGIEAVEELRRQMGAERLSAGDARKEFGGGKLESGQEIVGGLSIDPEKADKQRQSTLPVAAVEGPKQSEEQKKEVVSMEELLRRQREQEDEMKLQNKQQQDKQTDSGIATTTTNTNNSTTTTNSQPKSEGKDVVVKGLETHKFQAEVSRVMDIIINSLYTDKDVFLRELVSNAADACDKLRVTLSADDSYKGQGRIRIKADRDKRTLTIEDDGIGMTKEELIHNLGTIAQSGTAKFLQQVSAGKADASLIGQFGVGFYSAYLVADQVEVVTKSPPASGGRVWRWRSTSGGTFTVCQVEEDEDIMKDRYSGTKIFLHLKDDCDEYLEDYKIKDLLRKYSEFVQYPIQVWSEKVEYERVTDNKALVKPGEKPRIKTVTRRFNEWEHVNTQPPIWRRAQQNVKDVDYYDFYKSTFKSYDDPMAYTHFKVEGQVDFCSVLYIPGSLPYELSKNMFDEESRGVRLYVKRIFINDQFTEQLPRWLKFLRGVVDSEDLPLNVGREILQKSKILAIINKRITQKAIDMMKGIKAEGKEKWKKFLTTFGKYLKVGVVEDKDHLEQLASLIEFWSTNSTEEETGLDDYIARMPESQKAIYYVAADTRQAAEDSPALEKLRKLGFEVLYCTEPVDEFALSSMTVNKFRGYAVLDANKADLKLSNSGDSADAMKQKKLDMEFLCEWLQNYFGKKVHRVAASDRLTESPAILVQGDYGLSPTMQRYMKQQATSQGMSDQDVYGMNMNQAVLEINPDHAIIKKLHSMVRTDRYSEGAKEMAQLIFEVSGLQGGYTVDNPNAFAKRIVSLMTAQAQRSSNLVSAGFYSKEADDDSTSSSPPSTTSSSSQSSLPVQPAVPV
eukprot:GHVS01022373.1.p1 GENE.GHVS01022373.1~~GHVS01022373.1.p1  ORF type:complete len:1080 (+),score=259.54 GHVS01022373.1:40-3279(+)